MKLTTFWTLVPSFLLVTADFVLAAKVPLSSVQRGSKLPNNVVPNEFIIEVDELSKIPTKRSYARSLDAIYDHLQARDVSFDVKKEYDSAGIFVGAAVSVKDVATLASAPGVIHIHPILLYPPPKPVKSHVITGVDDPDLPPDGQSTHVMTGVDKLHNANITGAGIKIGIIDTGIDYKHPALGGAIGPGHKVVGGYDFVGDAFTGGNNPVPDDDPLDECNGHGTHVAGIVGANPGNQFNISGVAYDSEIFAYRVFGCDGSVPDDVLMDALLRADSDGNDIITLSIGGSDGWTEGVTSVVASRIAEKGKIVTIAAGNEGSSGLFYSAGPGNAIHDISVASVNSLSFPLQSVLVEGVTHDPIIYYSLTEFSVVGPLPIYPTSNDTTVQDDACAPLPDTTPNLAKYVVVIRRGTCNFVDKLANAADKGAQTILIYDNGRGFAGIDRGNFTDAALIQAADGEYVSLLVQQYVAGTNVTLDFPKGGRPANYPDSSGGLSSAFSTYGPSNDFYFKPAVAAPGGNIISTYPIPMGSYAVLSGTSMATPFVAGVSALLLQVRGKTPVIAHGARTLFETTATYIPSDKTEKSPLQTVAQQGAGLINAYDAIYATTTVSPGELILNDTAHSPSDTTFYVKNDGTESKKYTVKHVPAGTALTVQEGTTIPENGPVPLANASAQVTITPTTFEIGPGESQIVKVTFQLPDSVPLDRYPLYSGFIEVTGTSVSDTYHVSYIGLKGNLKNLEVLDNTNYFFGDTALPVLLDGVGDVQAKPTNYTFVGDDYPSLLFRLLFGSPAIRIDLVDPSVNFTATVPSNQPGRRDTPDDPVNVFSFPQDREGGSFASVKIIGTLAEYTYVTRNDEVSPLSQDNGYNVYDIDVPAFANGTTIPNGQYRSLLRALRITGDPTKEEDYDSWLSPIFGVAKSK
ncbi:pyrolysin [Crepidotus variabilis]|uniref:Pyrolysin n=1 Tax=Crepidotus variabilis TaxID=179855 RepID=A0A9P6ECP4_9AGAR|nr:pyrolysin [Crepidotus variabilis]